MVTLYLSEGMFDCHSGNYDEASEHRKRHRAADGVNVLTDSDRYKCNNRRKESECKRVKHTSESQRDKNSVQADSNDVNLRNKAAIADNVSSSSSENGVLLQRCILYVNSCNYFSLCSIHIIMRTYVIQ